jgi:multimeric flavodoxin WrbA
VKIVIINGTGVKGCTYHIKEIFLNAVKNGNEINEFTLPKELPEFCCGCKNCFFKGEDTCPHAAYTLPIWDTIMQSDLIVFTYPVYALRAPGSIKALLDHFCVHWIVHRPKEEMFSKRAVILTNSIGAPNGSAQKDVATSFSWFGVSDIKKLGFGLMEDVYWDKISEERRTKMQKKVERFARKCLKPIIKGSFKVKAFFILSRVMHQSGYKKELAQEKVPLLDNQYWAQKGWIKRYDR